MIQLQNSDSNNQCGDHIALQHAGIETFMLHQGGERYFSTLCFVLALHEMTEAPFQAMDEFDVFMDAVSRKITLDTLVDFAMDQGSQWSFITPHDISMMKAGERPGSSKWQHLVGFHS